MDKIYMEIKMINKIIQLFKKAVKNPFYSNINDGEISTEQKKFLDGCLKLAKYTRRTGRMGTNYWYEAFISELVKYVLLDDDGHIRATSETFEGIIEAKHKYGWGDIHKAEYIRKTLKIKEKVE